MAFQRTTYKDHVIEYIYDGLREERYRAGDKLLESRLAGELGISRAPIREALADLVRTGLLEYRPQVGHFVAALSAAEIIDSYVARGLLEGFAVAQGADNLTARDLQLLTRMACDMERFARQDRRRELIDIGRRFHAKLFSSCRNGQIVAFTAQLSLKLHLLFYKHWAGVYTPEEIRDRHLEILAAVREGDRQNIEQLIRRHYIETGRKVVARENEYPSMKGRD